MAFFAGHFAFFASGAFGFEPKTLFTKSVKPICFQTPLCFIRHIAMAICLGVVPRSRNCVWTRRDSNPWPPRCKRGDLPADLRARPISPGGDFVRRVRHRGFFALLQTLVRQDSLPKLVLNFFATGKSPRIPLLCQPLKRNCLDHSAYSAFCEAKRLSFASRSRNCVRSKTCLGKL